MDTSKPGRYGRINHFRANVEVLLAKRGKRMIDLARDMGVAQSTLRDMVNRGRPRESTLWRFADTLNVDVEELVKTISPEEYGKVMIPRIE